MDQDKRFEIYERDGYKCQWEGCDKIGFNNIELAHQIHQGKQSENYVKNYVLKNYNIDLKKKQLKEIINNKLNIKTSCKKHNSYFNCLFKPNLANKIIDDIIEREFL